MIGMKAHYPVDHRSVSARAGLQPVPHKDPLQHERAALQLDLTGRVGVETAVSGWNAARLQRAAQRPGQSASRRRDDVVQRGRMRLILALYPPVVRGDLAVDAEHHRGALGRHGGVPGAAAGRCPQGRPRGLAAVFAGGAGAGPVLTWDRAQVPSYRVMVRVEVSPEAVAFIQAHGGRLWVWAARPRMCCQGTPAYMHAATDPPRGVSGFSPAPAAGLDICFRAPAGRLPDILEIGLRGRRRPRVEAYWDGCLIAL